MDSKFKIGYIGYGNRGSGGALLSQFLKMDDVDVVAVCDLVLERQQAAAEKVKDKRGYTPVMTDNYKDLLEMELDAVINGASWESHINIAIDCMNAGIPIAVEVGGAYSVDEVWELVKTYERTKVPCMMLTNVRYMKKEMALVNMARQGIFGKIVHCDGGYCHDLRKSMVFKNYYRLPNYMLRNADTYPCHALGPILSILDINRGNKMVSLSSVASCSAGLHNFIKSECESNHPLADYNFAQGDIVTTTIKCARGETITLRLDTTLPRPYSRRFEIHGTKGMFAEDGNYVYLHDEHKDMHERPLELYNNADEYIEKYNHHIWSAKNVTKGTMFASGHGGSDGMVCRAFIESVRDGLPMPTDIYDTAILMCITALSEQSVAMGGAPVAIPDFTKGAYITRTPLTQEDNPWSI